MVVRGTELTHGAPWDRETCIIAALNGHLPCLRYAFLNGCTNDDLTCVVIGAMNVGWNIEEMCFNASRGIMDCMRFTFLVGATQDTWWVEVPAKMVAWRDRVRGTAALILRIVRKNRAHRAATVIQQFWLQRHYMAGGRGEVLALARIQRLIA